MLTHPQGQTKLQFSIELNTYIYRRLIPGLLHAWTSRVSKDLSLHAKRKFRKFPQIFESIMQPINPTQVELAQP